MVRVVIVDDHEMVRDGLRRILHGAEAGIEVVGLAASGEEALQVVQNVKPDVVLMDIVMPGIDGLETTALVREMFPETKVITLTTFDDDDYIVKVIRAGASAYLLKAIPTNE